MAKDAYKLNDINNTNNLVSSSEYLLPKSEGLLIPPEALSTATSQDIVSSSINPSSLSPHISKSNHISQNIGTNHRNVSEDNGVQQRGHHANKYASDRESKASLVNGHSPKKREQGLTRENVNDHNHINSRDFTKETSSEVGKSSYMYKKARQGNQKHSSGKDITISENEVDLDQTTMIGSALDLDSLSDEEHGNNKHIISAQNSNNCDENAFVTTKASSVSEQCKTAGISSIYQEKRMRTNINSTRQSIVSGNNETYFQAPNRQKSFDPSAV